VGAAADALGRSLIRDDPRDVNVPTDFEPSMVSFDVYGTLGNTPL